MSAYMIIVGIPFLILAVPALAFIAVMRFANRVDRDAEYMESDTRPYDVFGKRVS